MYILGRIEQLQPHKTTEIKKAACAAFV